LSKPRSRGFVVSFFRILRKSPSSMLGFAMVMLFILMAAVGPEILPFDYGAYPSKRYFPPSWEHPLGTDFAGRDVLRQLVVGSRDVLVVAFLTGLITTAVGLVVGISSGMVGGWFDAGVMAVTDVFLIIPSFPLLLIIAASLPRTLSAVEVAFVISIVGWPALARSIRAQILSLREKPFIEAARCLNLSKAHILFSEMLPNLLPYIAVSFVYSIVGGIYSQTGLFFLGILPFTSVNWGVMMNIAMGQELALINPKAWIYLFSPIACIVLILTGFILLQHTLEDVFNPRIRSEE